jgi:hypothetical protein
MMFMFHMEVTLISRGTISSGREIEMRHVEIMIKGHIDVEWSGRLDGLYVTHNSDGNTVLRGQVNDQPALYGLLNRLSDLGMQLISVSTGEANERKVERSQPKITPNEWEVQRKE